MDEMIDAISALISMNRTTAFVNLSEQRLTRALIWFAIGLFALANNWAVVGIPAFVLTSVDLYRAHTSHNNALTMLRKVKDQAR